MDGRNIGLFRVARGKAFLKGAGPVIFGFLVDMI